MADPRSLDIADLNEFGLPRHGDGVGPTLRPDIIAERHLHDWDRPEPAMLAPPEMEASSAALQALLTDDHALHPQPMAVAPQGCGLLDESADEMALGDNEQQGARRAHALAQSGEVAP